MVFIITYPEASVALKNMCPEFIVLPLLPLEKFDEQEKFKRWIKVFTSVCIGPGLGRDLKLIKSFEFILESLKNKIVVGDADFFWFFGQNVNLYKESLKQFEKIILTPNMGELKRMYKAALKKDIDMDKLYFKVCQLIETKEEIEEVDLLGKIPELREFYSFFENKNLFFIIKGKFDLIIGSNTCYVVRNKASLKRSGGQGDVLCGLSSLFVFWASKKEINTETSLAFSSYFVRKCSFSAFKKKKLGQMTLDIINELTDHINEFIVDEEIFKDDSLDEFHRINE